MTHTITIQGFAYNPPVLTITAGDSVEWTNHDGMAHTATRNEVPAFDTGDIGEKETSNPIIFDTVSDENGFEYRCTPHPRMRGHIIVVIRAQDSLLSYAADIRPLFRDSDIKAMIRFGGFDLSKYEDVEAHADSIYERLKDKTMPCDSPWPDVKIAAFKKWIDDGKRP